MTNRVAPGMFLLLLFALSASAQDTLTLQADGKFESEPDLATLTFHVMAQEKQLPKAYDRVRASLQRITALAERNGLAKDDFTTAAFTVFPGYDWGDRKLKTRFYRVATSLVMRIRDFQKIGPLIEESVEEGIVDFRSLTYSLEDEEAAKQKAIEAAMGSAEARARAALASNGRKLGALRSASIDVKEPTGILQLVPGVMAGDYLMEDSGGIGMTRRQGVAPPPSLPSAEKIVVKASVNCVFQLL